MESLVVSAHQFVGVREVLASVPGFWIDEPVDAFTFGELPFREIDFVREASRRSVSGDEMASGGESVGVVESEDAFVVDETPFEGFDRIGDSVRRPVGDGQVVAVADGGENIGFPAGFVTGDGLLELMDRLGESPRVDQGGSATPRSAAMLAKPSNSVPSVSALIHPIRL
nr:hypothetical protein [Nocardia pseudobrasiliensis]